MKRRRRRFSGRKLKLRSSRGDGDIEEIEEFKEGEEKQEVEEEAEYRTFFSFQAGYEFCIL